MALRMYIKARYTTQLKNVVVEVRVPVEFPDEDELYCNEDNFARAQSSFEAWESAHPAWKPYGAEKGARCPGGEWTDGTLAIRLQRSRLTAAEYDLPAQQLSELDLADLAGI